MTLNTSKTTQAMLFLPNYASTRGIDNNEKTTAIDGKQFNYCVILNFAY